MKKKSDSSDLEYDAIFIGGGGAGNMGATYLKMQGGKALIVDQDNYPSGKGRCNYVSTVMRFANTNPYGKPEGVVRAVEEFKDEKAGSK